MQRATIEYGIIDNGVIGSHGLTHRQTNESTPVSPLLLLSVSVLTEVAAEFPIASDGQQQDPPIDVVVAGHVQVWKQQENLVGATVLNHSKDAAQN